MKKFIYLISLSTLLIMLVGCSTMRMEQKVAENNRVDGELYGYEDESFTYQNSVLQRLADRFRLEELTSENVNSIMQDEIQAGYYNEVLIYLNYLTENNEQEAALYTERYYEALATHVQQVEDPSPQLLEDAIQTARVQYQNDPSNQRTVVHYANLLLYTDDRQQEGQDILFELKEHLASSDEEYNPSTIHALAQAYFLNEQYEESVDYYLMLSALDPDNAYHYYNISYVYEQMGDQESANRYLTKAYAPTNDFLKTYGTEAFGFYSSLFESATPSDTE
ncbi:hypothetical protein RYX56_08100 [Alkalihalophilus lindianensis]|uniref:Tetratricopeptide repeat protein n=1 Tax=Alkalihalophilus lindianensis TaxID=1630542 RepID=A0ABU3XA67_9BACI|nr:hypothetical protein [Alkalihalophilus lindianensis]MDV2684329.1 hypothetical protein [Alkalihalophilus lindianensis]